MAVPARPASGAPIDSAWGGVVHDTAVVQDIQVYKVTCTHSANVLSAPVPLTFARPYAVAPVVVCGSTNYNYAPAVTGVPSAAGCTVYSRRIDGSAASGSVEVHITVIGTRV